MASPKKAPAKKSAERKAYQRDVPTCLDKLFNAVVNTRYECEAILETSHVYKDELMYDGMALVSTLKQMCTAFNIEIMKAKQRIISKKRG